MPKSQNSDILSPELIKIIKIFGLISFALVLVLSFFNTKRANNTGSDFRFRMANSNRIYFLNMRTLQYEREVREEAGMTLFRHQDLSGNQSETRIDIALILNPGSDEAYLYLEPAGLEWPIELKVTTEDQSEEITLVNGDKTKHLDQAEEIFSWQEKNASFEVETENGWVPIWNERSQKEALKTIKEDYNRLVD